MSVDSEGTTTRGPGRRLGAVALGLLLTAGLGAWATGWPADTSESDHGGPLEFPDGFGFKLAAMPDAWSYGVFDACGIDGDIDVRLVSVEGVSVTGVDDVEFHAVWPRPDDRPLPGAAKMPLPEAYEPAEGSTGTVRSCAKPPAGLEIAAVFPPAVTEDIEVDGVTVVYEADGRQYTQIADVKLGICASEPVGTPSEYCG